jgi:hypothetical protein
MKIITFIRTIPKALWRFVIPIPPPPLEENTWIVVEPNNRGGWSVRVEDDSQQLGNYGTAADALRIARLSFSHVRLGLEPYSAKLVTQAAPAAAPQLESVS